MITNAIAIQIHVWFIGICFALQVAGISVAYLHRPHSKQEQRHAIFTVLYTSIHLPMAWLCKNIVVAIGLDIKFPDWPTVHSYYTFGANAFLFIGTVVLRFVPQEDVLQNPKTMDVPMSIWLFSSFHSIAGYLVLFILLFVQTSSVTPAMSMDLVDTGLAGDHSVQSKGLTKTPAFNPSLYAGESKEDKDIRIIHRNFGYALLIVNLVNVLIGYVIW